MKYLLILLCFMSIYACKEQTVEVAEKPKIEGVMAKNAMVVSARKEASEVGIEILKKGGNAFDAMIATEMALAVVYPYAGNLGGGGFMVYRSKYGEVGSFNYREKAPMAASRDMYLDDEGNYIRSKSKTGPLAVGVPGTIAGMFAVHEKMGSLPLEEILDPVIELAERGFVVTEKQAATLNTYAGIIRETSGEESIFTLSYKPGDSIRNLALANTLRTISKEGPYAFYQGSIAEQLVSFMQDRGGLITMEDLKAYEAKWQEPIISTYKDLKIISIAPPSSGGICLSQILKMIQHYDIGQYEHNSTKAIQLLTEAERRAYADRSFYLGDPDFVTIPVDSILDIHYLEDRMADFSFDASTPSGDIEYGAVPGTESTETTHYSIVDQFGNAVAATTTLNAAYGSKLYVKELGFFLNNEMDDFSAKPGEPNMFGLIGGTANAIAPQKRMLSSMTPTIVEKDDAPYMVVGTPGGSTIITSVLQTILNVYEFDMNMQEAVSAPRFHHQWLPDHIRFEKDRFEQSTLDSLQALGYKLDFGKDPVIGKVDAILFLENGMLEGGADPRGDDTAVGY